MATARNPETGERIYLDEATNSWQPIQTATNPQTGERLMFAGKGWEAAFPDIQPSFPQPPNRGEPSNTSSPSPLLARKAMREPQWPVPQGAAVAPPPISDMGPMSEGLGVDQSPFATPFPQPEGRFPLPPGAPPAHAPFPISDIGEATPGYVPDPNAPPVEPWRMAKMGAQALGTGAINLGSIAADVPAMGGKAIDWGVDWLQRKAGITPQGELREDQGIETPLPSDAAKDSLASIFQRLGYEPATPSTPGEKGFSNVLQFGAESGLGGGVLNQLGKGRAAALRQPGAMPLRGDRFVLPYAEQPLKTIAGDVAAGGGAGLGLTGSQEFLPKEFREAGGGTVGALTDLATMLAGATTAGSAASAVTGLPSTMVQAARGRGIATDVPVDPLTGKARQVRDVDEASRLVQGMVTNNPAAVAAEIAERAKWYTDRGLPVPTTGTLGTDQGLAGLETRARTQLGPGMAYPDPAATDEARAQWSFGRRDQAQRQEAANQVQGIRPGGISPDEFVRRAEERAAAERATRQADVTSAEGQASGVLRARREEAGPILAAEGQTPAASREIHSVYEQSRKLEQETRDALFKDPAWTESKVDITPLREAARAVNLESSLLTPVAAQAKQFIKRIFDQLEAGNLLAGKHLTDFNNNIEKLIKLSKDDGKLFNELKTLKDSVATSIDALPADHAGRQAIERAYAHQTGVTQPQFRQFAAGQLDRDIKRDPGQVYPGDTGPKLLDKGEDVSQTMTIARSRGQEPFVAGQARTVLLDEAVSAGAITADGVVDTEKLRRWRNQNQDRVNRVPGLGDELNTMIADARSGERAAFRREGWRTKAQEAQKATEERLTKGAVGKVLSGQDINEAIPAIMGQENAQQSMRDLVRQAGGTPGRERPKGYKPSAAEESLKASVSDHFINKVKALDAMNDADYAVNLRKLISEFDKNRAAMVEAGFTPEDFQALQRARELLLPLTKRGIQATVGSRTAESMEASLRPLELALKSYYGILRGGGVFRTFKVALKTVTGDRTSDVGSIVNQMMFDPKLANTLLTRELKSAGSPAWNSELQKALRRFTVAKDLARPAEDEAEQ